ncbi:MAG: ATP-binding protein [Desulfatiglandales bacterium]
MKLERKTFRTKVATRVFTLFIICAIVPIVGFSIISFTLVKKEIKEQSLNQLHHSNKETAVSISERLFLFQAELRIVASSLRPYPENSIQSLSDVLTKELGERLCDLFLITDKGSTSLSSFSQVKSPPYLTIAERKHIKSGKALLHQELIPNLPPRLFIGVLLDPDHPNRGALLGEINSHYLWRVADRIPPTAELFVLDRQNNVLFSSLSYPVSFPALSLQEMNLNHSGQFEWIHKAKRYLADYTSLFLGPTYFFPRWTVVLSESRDEALSPMGHLERWFPIITIISLGMVFLLSINLIRTNMGPIEILQHATHKIADGAFGHKVEIESGDEFETLGRSFNEMSKKLKEGQELLVQSAKLSGMGEMAAGMIHEVKQPITAIHGLLQISMMEQISDKNKEHLETALKAVERLDSILSKFRAFSRPHDETIETLSITKPISHVYQLLAYQLNRKNIQCTIEEDKNLLQIRGYSQELEQVFSNLLINAIHALEEKVDGKRLVSIKAYSTEDKVLVEIEDNGFGIPEEIQERIFDPFFTTKDADKGTGLGMAIVASILSKHKAKISFESKVGVGTKFTIVFPVLSKIEG